MQLRRRPSIRPWLQLERVVVAVGVVAVSDMNRED
jgi:hypothetical protein